MPIAIIIIIIFIIVPQMYWVAIIKFIRSSMSLFIWRTSMCSKKAFYARDYYGDGII